MAIKFEYATGLQLQLLLLLLFTIHVTLVKYFEGYGVDFVLPGPLTAVLTFDPWPQDLLWRAARDLSSLSRADLPLRPRRPVKGAPQRGHTGGELRSAA